MGRNGWSGFANPMWSRGAVSHVEQQHFALEKDGMGLADYISGLSTWSKTVYFQGALAVKCPRCKCVYFVKRELSNMFFP